MPVGQLRQPLEAPVAEQLPLAAQHRPRGRSGHLAQGRVHCRRKTHVGPRVAARERLRRRPAAAILDPARGPVLRDQARQLRPRQPRHLAQAALHQALARLAQTVILQPHQRAPHQAVDPRPVRDGKIHRLAAFHKSPNLFQAPNPFSL